jgi:hypothetical protein
VTIFEERWLAALGKLKESLLNLIDMQDAPSKASFDAECGRFTMFLRANQGLLRQRTQNIDLVASWNQFVHAANNGSDPNEPVQLLLDAIDDAMAASATSGMVHSPIGPVSVGNAGTVVVGHGNTLKDFQVVQSSAVLDVEFDLEILAKELPHLRAKMRQLATTLEEDATIGALADAEKAARDGDKARARERLNAAGKWALEMAKDVGTPVLVALLKSVIGLPEQSKLAE